MNVGSVGLLLSEEPGFTIEDIVWMASFLPSSTLTALEMWHQLLNRQTQPLHLFLHVFGSNIFLDLCNIPYL